MNTQKANRISRAKGLSQPASSEGSTTVSDDKRRTTACPPGSVYARVCVWCIYMCMNTYMCMEE